MDKKKFAIKFLSILDGFEYFYAFINKKLNSNKLSKNVESLFRKKIKIGEIFNIDRIGKNLKSLFHKKLTPPNWLVADGFLKGIRLYVQSKFGVTSSSNVYNSKKVIEKSRKNRLKNLILLIKGNIKSTGKVNKKFFEKVIKKPSYKLVEIYTQIKGLNPLRKNNKVRKSIKVDNRSQTIAIAFYADHFLTIARISITPSNQIVIRGVVEVPIPGHIVGDSLVEDVNELANIILDLYNLLNLNKAPLLLALSSSFFNVNTFFSSELKQISNTDSKIQSKSPYLPADTFVEFQNMSKRSAENKLIRTVYVRRKLIESWTNTLEIIGVPIIGLIPSAPNLFDILTKNSKNSITVLVDIEISSTTVLIGKNSAELTSYRLPYGSSLYVSENSNNELSNNYFIRILASLELLISNYNEELPESIFLAGQGLDHLIKREKTLPDRFRRVSDMNLSDYSYIPRKMEIHELVSKSIDSTIDTLSTIASSCL
tara:strand:- start:462 stop:1913 length:1452 start_codon:yes stop_codon:yes gene_type:complete